MPVSVTSLGSNSTVTGSSGATLALTLGASVAAGSLIVVLVTEGDNNTLAAGCSVTDTAGNTYSQISARKLGDVGSGFSQLFYAKNVSALSAGNTITVTKQDTNAALVVEAIAATGVDTVSPLDTAVTATSDSAGGLTATPSVTSGAGSQNGNLVVGAMAWQDSNATTAAQPGGWTSDANTKNASATTRGVGATLAHLVNSGTTAQTYAPTLGASSRWAAFVVGFKPSNTLVAQTVNATCSSATTFGPKTVRKAIAVASTTVTAMTRKVSKTLAVACVSAVVVLRTRPITITVLAHTSTTVLKVRAATINAVVHTSVAVRRAVSIAVVANCVTVVRYSLRATMQFVRNVRFALQKLRNTDPKLNQ